MNAFVAIKRKAKSAYHSGGLRTRKGIPMKRKSVNSEPDAGSRPKKSPRTSQVSNAEPEPIVKIEGKQNAEGEQGPRVVHEATFGLRRSQRLRNKAESGQQAAKAEKNASLTIDTHHALADQQPHISEAREAGGPGKPPKASEMSTASGNLDAESAKPEFTPTAEEEAAPESVSTAVHDPTPEDAISERSQSQTRSGQRDENVSILHDNRLDISIQGAEVDAGVEDQDDTWKQQQAIRGQLYIEFFGEDADDYTRGPVRVINCHDGVSTCACVLLKLDFTAKVRDALREQKEFEKLESDAKRKKCAGIRLEDEIEAEISSHRSRLRGLEKTEAAESETDKQRSLQKELDVLEMMLAKSKSERQHDQVVLNSRAQTLRRVQAEANAYLEEAFLVAHLLEPTPDEPNTAIDEPDLQEEYRRFCEAQLSEGSDRSISALDISRGHAQVPPPPSAEEQAKQDLVNSWWSAHDRLQEAQADFDSKEHSRGQAKVAFKAAIKRGEHSEADTAEKFDLPWLKRFQEITRELIDAEKAFSIARANAMAAGIVIKSEDEESYCSSTEPKATNQLEKAPRKPIFVNSNPKVSDWLDRVSGTVSLDHEEEATEATESEEDAVFFNESVSVVAKGLEREQINQWEHRSVDENGEEEACQDEESEVRTPGEVTDEPVAREHGRWSKIRGVKELLAALKEPRHL